MYSVNIIFNSNAVPFNCLNTAVRLLIVAVRKKTVGCINDPPRSTQPPPLSGTGNDDRPKLRLASKGRRPPSERSETGGYTVVHFCLSVCLSVCVSVRTESSLQRISHLSHANHLADICTLRAPSSFICDWTRGWHWQIKLRQLLISLPTAAR